jgi:hypothetical protein
MDWKVGQVEDTRDDHGSFTGSEFTIIEVNTERPIVTFGYSTQESAERARALIVDALREAKSVD